MSHEERRSAQHEAQALVEALRERDEALSEALRQWSGLEEALERLIEAGDREWGAQVALAQGELGEGLSARLATSGVGRSEEELSGWFGRLLGGDVHMAVACEAGMSAALQGFERRYKGELGALLRRYQGPKMPEEDLRQHLFERLFVDSPERPAKIRSYSGHGSLKSWLQVTGTRLFIDMLRVTSRRHQEQPMYEEGGMLQLPDPEQDPELQFLKQEYRAAFKDAFERAARALTSQERNLLRQHLVGGLTVDQLGKLYDIHRATAARRVARAREELLANTRRELSVALNLSESQFESVMELIRSKLDLSMPRLLATATHTRDV